MVTDQISRAAARGSTPGPRPGLRERKKAQTRAAIRAAALELFESRGYANTTVAQIADAANVSHTTFFRYFQTKEQVMLGDDIAEADRLAMFATIPRGLGRFDLLRRIITGMFEMSEGDEWATSSARWKFILSEPALMSAITEESMQSITEATGFIADYLGVAPDDYGLRVFVAAMAGILFHVVDQEGASERLNLGQCLEAIDMLEAGLPVGTSR